MQCQIETLRRSFPPSIRRILGELPKTLDETYERMLLEIDEEKRTYAHRLFQCLVTSIRPLRVEELADLFAILPDGESITRFNIGWRPHDPEQFILSTCSTLIAIVNVHGERLVQFSHFSVREYLTSDRISNSAPVFHFHIPLKPAHTLFAKACLSVLLQLDHRVDETNIRNFPLAFYAAEHWVDHALFEDISLDIRDGMDCLFDKDKPHFAAWTWLYDADNRLRKHGLSPHPEKPDAVPLYYAALCGFRDLAERLLNAHPQDVNPPGGFRKTPLHAALDGGHCDIASLFLDRGADVETQGLQGHTPLYIASSRGYYEAVRSLIDHGADPNVECNDWEEHGRTVKRTPLLVVAYNGYPDIVPLLLDHGAEIEARGSGCQTALYIASSFGYADVVRSLIGHGADLNSECDDWDDYQGGCDVNWTPLLVASKEGSLEVTTVLLDHGSHVNFQDKWGRSPLQIASRHPSNDLTQLLLNYGANLTTSDTLGNTPLHGGAFEGHVAVVTLLLEYGANVDVCCESGCTPLLYAASKGHLEVVQLLLDHGADVKAHNEDCRTALHKAAYHGRLQVVEILLRHCADPHARDRWGRTPFLLANTPHPLTSRQNCPQIKRLLSERTGERI